MHERKAAFPPAAGGSAMLVIFAVLCLVVFALLTLSTVLADKRISDSAEKAAAGYYTADSQAETVLAQLRCGVMPEGVTAEGSGIFTYACEISDTQELCVKVRVSGENYEILRWQAVSTAEWKAESGPTPRNAVPQGRKGVPSGT